MTEPRHKNTSLKNKKIHDKLILMISPEPKNSLKN